jgi:hypothetical protein
VAALQRRKNARKGELPGKRYTYKPKAIYIYIYIYITRERLLRIKKVEAKQIHKHLRRKKESNMKNKDEA